MKVCAVILSFDERKNFLPQVIAQLTRIGVAQIIIVDNSDQRRSHNQVADLANAHIRVLPQDRNLGSAGGYACGIEAAMQTDAEFFWLLDEDNFPEADALVQLQKVWQQASRQAPEQPMMLLSYRPQLFPFLNAKVTRNSVAIAPRANSFLGFHYRRLWSILTNRLRIQRNRGRSPITKDGQPLSIDAAYYGGLFAPRIIFEAGYYPNRELFLYWDDVELARRFLLDGGQIYLVPGSIVHDLDQADLDGQRSRLFGHPVLTLTPNYKAYYYTRNLIWFERRYLKKKALSYGINRVLALCILRMFSLLQAKPSRIKMLYRAMRGASKL